MKILPVNALEDPDMAPTRAIARRDLVLDIVMIVMRKKVI